MNLIRNTSRQCVALNHAVRLPAGIAAPCALAAFFIPVLPVLLVLVTSPAHAQQAGTVSPTIRVVGPPAAKEMVEEIASEFNRSRPRVAMEYVRAGNLGSAVGGLLVGRDMMVFLGKIEDKDLRSDTLSRWKALAPEEHAIGALAVAIVVHGSNMVESLTLTQLQAIFSKEAKDWTVFGGPKKSIRRYGLPINDPVTRLFHGEVLASRRCRMIVLKKDSKAALATLASDPAGIAFVDAVAAASAGEEVKTIAIAPSSPFTSAVASDDKSAVTLNAQTIKDGTYPLSTKLMLYVSPKASPTGQEFAKFILAGKGDAICRKHGFMPTLRIVRADVLAMFKKLYGPDISRVKATPETADDFAMAGQLIQSVCTTKLDSQLMVAMCEAAYDLTAGVSGGETLAFEALDVLTEKVPDKRFDCAVKHAAVCERVYGAGKLRADGEHLVGVLVATADLGLSVHRFVEARDVWKTAMAVAEEINSSELATIKNRNPAFAARVESVHEAKALATKLQENPQDAEARSRMLVLQLVELDDPVEAARYLAAASMEAMKTNVPVAAEPLDKLPEEAALKLAEWYAGMVDSAGIGGKELMAARARSYYMHFFKLHRDREDILAMRAALGIQKVGGKAPNPPPKPRPGVKPPPRRVTRAALKPGETMTNLRLAEFVAANRNLTELTRREIGTAGQISDLRPLTRLTRLTRLELRLARKIIDISPMAELSNLTFLTISDPSMDGLSALSGLSKLTVLNLYNAESISDIAPIGRLLGLRTLTLARCVKVSDLAPLSHLVALQSLDLSGCHAVRDIASLQKLSKNLTTLSLSGTEMSDITPLARLTQLKKLDLRRCEKITADDIEWLRKRLPECKVLSD